MLAHAYRLDMASKRKRAARRTLEDDVEAFRALVWQGVRTAIESGRGVQPYEGALHLGWAPFLRMHSRRGRYSLHLSCSVFGGPTNHYAWRGRTWGEVFRKATADVEHWISEIGGKS